MHVCSSRNVSTSLLQWRIFLAQVDKIRGKNTLNLKAKIRTDVAVINAAKEI